MKKELTDREVEMCNETHIHISRVNHFLNKFITSLLKRGEEHDSSKFEDPELSILATYTPMRAEKKDNKSQSYGTKEYKETKKKMQVALDHHYTVNSHHPEHYSDGVLGMNLLDLVEMLCDWRAATERNPDGDIRKSIKINAAEKNIPESIVRILENSVNILGD